MWIELPQISLAARTGACSVCGSNVPEIPALTSGVEVEFEGNIEVCKRCIVEAAEIFGMHTDESFQALMDQLAELQAWADNAYEELQVKDTTIQTLVSSLAQANA